MCSVDNKNINIEFYLLIKKIFFKLKICIRKRPQYKTKNVNLLNLLYGKTKPKKEFFKQTNILSLEKDLELM